LLYLDGHHFLTIARQKGLRRGPIVIILHVIIVHTRRSLFYSCKRLLQASERKREEIRGLPYRLDFDVWIIFSLIVATFFFRHRYSIVRTENFSFVCLSIPLFDLYVLFASPQYPKVSHSVTHSLALSLALSLSSNHPIVNPPIIISLISQSIPLSTKLIEFFDYSHSMIKLFSFGFSFSFVFAPPELFPPSHGPSTVTPGDS
jgi:hypothetical protein